MNSPNVKRNSNSNDAPDPVRAGDLLRSGEERLRVAGVDSPRFNAEKLLAHAFGCDRSLLLTRSKDDVPPEVISNFEKALRRRELREPLQHILGETEFWSLPIFCDRRALVPRPETEVLVRTALDLIREVPSPRIAEIGAGSGCIAVALAHERPDARIVAADIDPDALALAESNLKRHNLTRFVELIQGDLAGPFAERGDYGSFDLAVSNPPYIETAELERLEPEVREHDPRRALDGGRDGLEVIRRLVDEIPPLLRAGGFLVMEIGAGQAGSVREMIRSRPGWGPVRTLRDGAGIERVVVARKENDAWNPSRSKAESPSTAKSA
jgi:release factor glutamine methyltransferase